MSVQEIIDRCKAKQRDWWKHLKAQGWHLCSVCKKNPIEKSKSVCAFCDHRHRRYGAPKPPKPQHPTLPGLKKEESDE